METKKESEKTDTTVKEPENKLTKRIIVILVLLVIGLTAALIYLTLMRREVSSNDAVPTMYYGSQTDTDEEVDEEVDVKALLGSHTGRMMAKNNETSAVIDYRLVCSQSSRSHPSSLLSCNLVQVGCATVKEVNGTHEEEKDEECLMEDMEFNFELDGDGKFYTNDSELFDPVRLAVALYSKHLSVPDMDGKIEERSVEKMNSTHAVVTYEGLTLEVMEIPENLLKKSSGRRRRSARFANTDSQSGITQRNRRSVSTGPILRGAFGNSFKRAWNVGPYLKIPNLFSKSGREGIVKYDFSLTNFEILLSSLPDIRVSLSSRTSTACTVNLKADFSQNGRCNNVIQSRVKLYLYARACVWWFCFAKARKNNHVSLDFTPVMDVSTTLQTQPGNKLQYSFELKKFSSGTNSDIGSVSVNINVASVVGLVLFGPLGFLGGFLLDRYFERMTRRIHNDYNARVPGIIDSNVKTMINKNLPRSGSITIPSSVMGPLYQLIRSCNNANSLTLQLSHIGGFLQNLPPLFQPNRIPCSGNGRILTVHDRCMHDYGTTGGGDHLEIYCYRGAKRFCLSHELCPWRTQRSHSCAALFELTTCSVAGLNGVSMATTWGVTSSCRRHCSGSWWRRRCSTRCSCSGSTYRNVQCHRGSVRAT